MSGVVASGAGLPDRVPVSLLARMSDWLARMALREARGSRLPFTGLPQEIGDVPPGEVAVILCADAASREGLLLSLLDSTLARGRVTWICAPDKTPPAVGTDIRLAAQSQHLRALSWTQDAATQLRQHGPKRLVRELASSGLRAQDLLILDAIDPWLSETPESAALEAGIAEAMQCLLRWSREHRGPVIALAPAHHRGRPLLPLLAKSNLRRLASLRIDRSSAYLDVIHWGPARRNGARSNSASIALDAHPGGSWHCRQSASLDAAGAVAADDAATVHTTRNILCDASGTPAGWQVHPNVDALIGAARDAVAATVVLAHDQPDAVARLADAVHKLRKEHPHLLKIIVRETDATMRKNGSLALLRLGANAVMERELGFPHLVQLVSDMRDETFAEPQSTDPAQTLRSLAPDPVHGYLPPAEFCAAVERMLDRTSKMPLQHSLVQIPLLPHVAHVDALLACNPRRDGDIVSADARGLFLFLFGCAPDDAIIALDSVFTVPCSELAPHIQIDPDTGSQFQTLAALRRATEESPVDYSVFLRGVASSRKPAAVRAAVLPTRSPEQARCVHAHVLPLRAAAA